MSLPRFAYLTVALIGIVYFLVEAQSLLQPIVIAACIWYLTRAISDQIARLGLPRGLCTVLASVVIIVFIVFSIEIIANNVESMIKDAPTYKSRIENIQTDILTLFGVEKMPNTAQLMDTASFQKVIGRLGNTLSSFAGNLVLVIVYTIFFLLESTTMPAKWQASFRDKENLVQATKTVKRISKSVRHYLSVKTALSLLTAGLAWGVMAIVGLEYAIFWAFLIFLLNFIPAIGSLLATIFPVLFSILQFETLTNTLILLVVIASIQFSVANLLEPRLLGRTLNISGLVVLIALSLWGAIWDITGMILSVPITVTMIIIFSEFESTRAIAVWLSADGKVLTEEEWDQQDEEKKEKHSDRS